MAMHLIESSHDPLSSGYTYDSVPPGRAVMERDKFCDQVIVAELCIVVGLCGIEFGRDP